MLHNTRAAAGRFGADALQAIRKQFKGAIGAVERDLPYTVGGLAGRGGGRGGLPVVGGGCGSRRVGLIRYHTANRSLRQSDCLNVHVGWEEQGGGGAW